MTTDSISPETAEQLTDRETITYIQVTDLVGNPSNPRRAFRTSGPDWDLFVQSIRENGIIEPLIVRPLFEPNDNVYEIVAGHRRHAGAEAALQHSVPCIVRELTDEQALVLMLVENLQRVDLDPVEEASGYFRLVECGMTQADMAERVGRSKKHVGQRLQLLNAPAKVLALVKKGEFPIEDALEYSKIDDPEVIEAALSLIGTNGRCGPEWALARGRESVEAKRVTDAVLADLEAKKIRAVVTEGWGFDYKEAGLTPLSDLGMANSAKGVADKDWLVAVVQRGKKQVTFATDDKRAARQYAPKEAVPESEKAAKEKERAKRRIEKEAKDKDNAALVAAAKGKTTLGDLVGEAGGLLVQLIHVETAKALCRLLELDFDTKDYDSPKRALREHVSPKLMVHLLYGYELQRRYSDEGKAEYAEFLKGGDG